MLLRRNDQHITLATRLESVKPKPLCQVGLEVWMVKQEILLATYFSNLFYLHQDVILALIMEVKMNTLPRPNTNEAQRCLTSNDRPRSGISKLISHCDL